MEKRIKNRKGKQESEKKKHQIGKKETKEKVDGRWRRETMWREGEGRRRRSFSKGKTQTRFRR